MKLRLIMRYGSADANGQFGGWFHRTETVEVDDKSPQWPFEAHGKWCYWYNTRPAPDVSTPSTYTPDVSKSGLEIDTPDDGHICGDCSRSRTNCHGCGHHALAPKGMPCLFQPYVPATPPADTLTCGECPCWDAADCYKDHSTCAVDDHTSGRKAHCRFPSIAAAAILAERAREGK